MGAAHPLPSGLCHTDLAHACRDLPVPFPCGHSLYPWEFKIGVCGKAWGTRRGESWGPFLEGQVEGAGGLGKCICV